MFRVQMTGTTASICRTGQSSVDLIELTGEVVQRMARQLIKLLSRLAEFAGLIYEQQLETEKLAAMRQLAYGASHEIDDPLANISSRTQMLLRDERDPQRRRWLTTINSQAFHHEMIADMMLFAKPPALELVRSRMA